MRVPSSRPCNNGGWLHPMDRKSIALLPPKPERKEPPPDLQKVMVQWQQDTPAERVQILSKDLGLPPSAVLSLSPAWAPQRRSYAFAMRDGAGRLIGIRLRTESGFKWAVAGSQNGLFIPDVRPEALALVVEGVTSCAAGIALGWYTLGLPCAGAGVSMLVEAIRRLGIRRVVVLADNKVHEDGTPDGGINAARRVSEQLPVPSAVTLLPAKDLRDAVQFGMTSDMLDGILDNLIWMQP